MLILEGATLSITKKIVPNPLVRTKTERPGEEATVTLKMSSSLEGDLQYGRCVELLLKAAGVEFKLPSGGPIRDAFVTFTNLTPNLIVSPAALNDREWHDRTDANGITWTTVTGQSQPSDLPDNAAPVKRVAKVNVAINPDSAESFWDTQIAAVEDGLTLAAGIEAKNPLTWGVPVVHLALRAAHRFGWLNRDVAIPVTDWAVNDMYFFAEPLVFHASYTSHRIPYHLDIDYKITGQTCGEAPTVPWREIVDTVTWNQTGYAEYDVDAAGNVTFKLPATPPSGTLHEGFASPVAGGHAYTPGDVIGTFGTPLIGPTNRDAGLFYTAQIIIKPYANPHPTPQQPYVGTATLVVKPALPGAQVKVDVETVRIGAISGPPAPGSSYEELWKFLKCSN
jgi:hypothetical protein